jgi:hypothetical protein
LVISERRKTMSRFSIEQTILEKVVNYLVTKPFIEVSGIMSDIQQDVKPIVEEKKKKRVTPSDKS